MSINKYKLWYDLIIQKAKIRDSGNEKHHIIPRALGGLDTDENLVSLTYREHYLCHKLLVKFTFGRDRHSMLKAVMMMAKSRKSKLARAIPTREYDSIRRSYSQSLKDFPPSYDWLRKPKSEDHKRKIGEGNSGKTLSTSTKQKISNSHQRLSGSDNPAARTWLITHPDGTEYQINGSLRSFCADHNLPFATMGRLGRENKISHYGRCKGWSIKRL
jgi:hypothetical protein